MLQSLEKQTPGNPRLQENAQKFRKLFFLNFIYKFCYCTLDSQANTLAFNETFLLQGNYRFSPYMYHHSLFIYLFLKSQRSILQGMEGTAPESIALTILVLIDFMLCPSPPS